MTLKIIIPLLALVLLIPLGLDNVFVDKGTRNEQINNFGTEAEQIAREIQTIKDPIKKEYLEKRLYELISEMNDLGIPTQEQADENPQYWLLRSYYAELDESENRVQNILYQLSPIVLDEQRQMKFQLGYSYPCYWFFECSEHESSWTYVQENHIKHDEMVVGSYL